MPSTMPPLDSLVIRTQRGAKSPPRVEVTVGHRMDKTSRAHDSPEDIAIIRDRADPPHRLVHPIDLIR